MINKYVFIAVMSAAAVIPPSCKTQRIAFSKTAGGLEYRIVRDEPGGRKPETGDYMLLHIKSYLKLETGDTILYNSRIMNNNHPVPFQVTMPASAKGDISEGLLMLTEGDSAVFRMPVDSMISEQYYSWMEHGKNLKVEYTIKVAGIRSKSDSQK
jgi:hypothetical protein